LLSEARQKHYHYVNIKKLTQKLSSIFINLWGILRQGKNEQELSKMTSLLAELDINLMEKKQKNHQ